MTINGRTGYQPQTRSNSSRRADFDLQRRIAALEAAGGNGGGGTAPNEVTIAANPPTDESELWVDSDTNTIYAFVNGSWVAVGGGGGGGADEVWIGPNPPTDPTIELWYDPDAVAPTPSATSYRHVQGVASATWTITHNLGFYPNVIIEDSGGSTCEGEIVWNNDNQITVTFSVAFAGVAYLS